MELTPGQLAVLQIFKEHEIEQGEYLASQTFGREIARLPQEIQDVGITILRSLVKSHLSYHPPGGGLDDRHRGGWPVSIKLMSFRGARA